MNLTKDQFAEMLAAGLAAVESNKEQLSALDSSTGDGDHGIAMCEALKAAMGSIKVSCGFKEMLNDMGFAVMMSTGGSMSTLLGALFLGMSDGVDSEQLTPGQTAVMFRSGLENIRRQTRAGVGDKTMMDALIPAVEAMEDNSEGGLETLFVRAALAAGKGRETTINMVAKFGRARNLGERVIGHADAGATSISLLFKAFADAIRKQ